MEEREEIIDLSQTSLDDSSVLESVIYTTSNIENYDKVKQENSLFCEILEKCLNIENSDGMLSIINNKMIASYNGADSTYRTSSEFQRLLKKTLALLNKNPLQRCTHMQFLCKMLSSSIVKKKVPLITLDNEVTKNRFSKLSCKRVNTEDKPHNKILKTKQDELIMVENGCNVEEIPNSCNINVIEVNSVNGETDNEIQINSSCEDTKNDNKLLIPLKTVEFSSTEKLKADAIKRIERKIAICRNRIAKLDEEEVGSDSIESPYIKSEKLKAKIVLLYQELCDLTGEEPVKRRQVCIKAMEGHPPGSLKRLETFLNDNIGSDGHPPFPNFRDVVKCVLLANKEDGLGWGKAQVMNEARALFTYCGRALQKRRQKREYEDLISKVEVCEEDPADNDPELLAKLEANKQIGVKKELEVLQKFTMMQNSGDKMEPDEDIYSDSESSENSPNVSTHSNYVEPKDNKDVNMNEEKVINEKAVINEEAVINHEEAVINYEKAVINHEKAVTNDEQAVVNDEETVINDINGIKIKQEPVDNVVDMLNELGDNFKTTLLEIENPVFYIEILDSSEEEC